ncbi:hypothetical protein DDZ18_07140 [Marinicauda salina]|uniref:Uncharacterized protein n=1 Tax=Marinicauda salina TaxID=2135793 RepID=A0A2U2BTU8_9PROT|nr:hypothetical protein [Marinicauda salina]PWE17448.1 hypothetical protein DDZ18_07140 [Marinicauda salina]
MRRKDLIGIFNLIIVAGVLGAISYAALTLRPAEYDPDTLCLVGEEAPHTVVVIDKTDLYTPGQASRIESLVLEARNGLMIGERLSLFELDERGDLRNTNRFSLCNPGRGEQINPLYRNPARVEARYQALFEGPLQNALADLVEPKNAPQSPIIEALADLANEDTFDPDTPGRYAVLVSDMLQNSDLFSVYGAARNAPNRLPPPRRVANEIRAQYGDALDGVRVRVHLIPRRGWEAAQRGPIVDYWSELFRELGVRASFTEL